MTRRTLGLLVLPYGHDAFSPYFAKVTYRCMVGESVGDSSAGTANVRRKSVSHI